jgi:hypothetical protein
MQTQIKVAATAKDLSAEMNDDRHQPNTTQKHCPRLLLIGKIAGAGRSDFLPPEDKQRRAGRHCLEFAVITL